METFGIGHVSQFCPEVMLTIVWDSTGFAVVIVAAYIPYSSIWLFPTSIYSVM
jgi:hypothetical protein